jgi:hypothetical protein
MAEPAHGASGYAHQHSGSGAHGKTEAPGQLKKTDTKD